MKRLFKVLLMSMLIIAALSVALWYLAVRSTYSNESAPPKARIAQSFRASVHWMLQNEAEIIQYGNPMLWRMVREAAVVSGDPGLWGLSQRYRHQWVDAMPGNGWAHMFDPAIDRSSLGVDLASLNDYQRLFLYGMSCDRTLAARPEVQWNLTAGVCSPHLVKATLKDPPCVTHQLMGFMLMRENRCGDPSVIDRMVSLSHDRIQSQLAFDFRVTDAYLQRVMMLYRTGASTKVEAAWLNNVLSAQRSDGSWAGSYRLPWLGRDGRPFYWNGLAQILNGNTESPVGPGLFHATAQGVLLMALAMADHPDQQLQAIGWTPHGGDIK